MDQADLELQLKVWKDLAIGKQMLIRVVTDALELDPDCSTDELKVALDGAIKKILEADANVADAREKSAQAVAVMEKKVAASEKAQALAEDEVAKIRTEMEKLDRDVSAERASHMTEMNNIKAQLAEKDETLKNINRALADTPENVLKKMKTLKKQKSDEAAARKQVEASVTTLRKEKRTLEQKNTELKSLIENSGKLVEQHRELHTLCGTMKDQLKSLDANDLPTVPKVDEKLLEKIEEAAKADDKKDKKK